MKSSIAMRPACRLRKRDWLKPLSLRQEEVRGVGAKLSEAKLGSPGTSTSRRNYAQAELPHLFVKPTASASDTRMSWPRGERGALRAAPPPPPPLRHAGPCLGRPVGRERHVTRRAAPSPRAGLLLRPPGGFHHVARGRRPALPSPERGRGARRRGKGREKGREEESRGRNPSHVTQGQPGKLRGGAWRRHFPAAACPSCPVGLQLSREGVG